MKASDKLKLRSTTCAVSLKFNRQQTSAIDRLVASGQFGMRRCEVVRYMILRTMIDLEKHGWLAAERAATKAGEGENSTERKTE